MLKVGQTGSPCATIHIVVMFITEGKTSNLYQSVYFTTFFIDRKKGMTLMSQCEVNNPQACASPTAGGSATQECNMPEKLLGLADKAWEELMIEKLKVEIQASCGMMDEIAKVVANANKKKWQNRIAAKETCHDYRHQLKSIFTSGTCQE